MLTKAQIRDYLKTIFTADNYYIGRLDNKKDKSIGVYDLKTKNKPYIAIGGLECTSYAKKSVCILIHWNKNANETEIASNKLYQALLDKKDFNIDNIHIQYIELLVNQPVPVDTDDNNIYEYVIECSFIYRR